MEVRMFDNPMTLGWIMVALGCVVLVWAIISRLTGRNDLAESFSLLAFSVIVLGVVVLLNLSYYHTEDEAERARQLRSPYVTDGR